MRAYLILFNVLMIHLFSCGVGYLDFYSYLCRRYEIRNTLAQTIRHL